MPHRSIARVRFKIMPCRDYNAPMRVGANTKNAPRCVECGIAALSENIRQMTQKNGPAWDKYVAGTRRWNERIGRGTHPPTQVDIEQD